MKDIQLSFEEKLQLLTGINMWRTVDFDGKLPTVIMSDGPQTIPATSYPNLSMIGCSWDRELAEEIGDKIADECIEHGVDILLAPGVNMKRDPHCGRNFEYFSEDPYLTGELAYRYICGVQKRGIGTSLKHFAANNSENYRNYQNSEIDERTLHEIYFTAFKIALKAQPWTVMCSYNLVNGVYASENKKLLKDILRDKLGYNGVIVSDWGAVKNRARALKASLDIEMPYNMNSLGDLKEAYTAGYITEQDVEDAVERIFALLEKSEWSKAIRKVKYSRGERHETAVRVAEESIVLLKNQDNILPICQGASIDMYEIDLDSHCVSERIAGLGSSKVELIDEIETLTKALKKRGHTCYDNFVTYSTDTKGDYQIVCVYASSWETEVHDRPDLKLYKALEETVINVANNNPNTIVVVYSGSAVDLSRIADKVKGIIYVGFNGEGANEACAKIIDGAVCPSGKLAETFALHEEDYPIRASSTLSDFYKERFYIGYRYYDKYEVEPAFAFGFGLSYAKFEYSDLQIRKNGELDYEVSYKITNVSDRAGKEVSQVYVRDVLCTSDRPIKELKGFSKDFLQPQESKIVTTKLDKSAFAYYNASLNEEYVENGKFEIFVGASSREIKLKGEIRINLPKFTQYSPTSSRSY